MIETIRLKQFKAFEDTGEIEIKPITIIAGPNSGGKSTLLQSLLLLKQTLETERNTLLNLDGRFLQFSGIDEFTFNKPSPEECEVAYEFKINSYIPRDFVPQYFPDFKIPGAKRPEGFLFESRVKLAFRQIQYKDDKKQVGPYYFSIRCFLDGTTGPELVIRFYSGRHRVYFRGRGSVEPKKKKDKESINGVDFNNFLPFSFTISGNEKEMAGEHYSRSVQVDPIFRVPLGYLREELESNLKYLGPLREEPRRAYLHSGSLFPEIGKKGEYAAQLLWLEKDKKVMYIAGPSHKKYQMNLMTAVSRAFHEMGVFQTIDVSQVQRIVYQVLFGLEGAGARKKVTIADVGFGMSQLLPIILIGLRSDEDSILVFEQPEIHLHPKLQASLGDFFIILAQLGKRLIIETHSDHLINRLRRRIVEDKSDKLKDSISILFVHPPKGGEGATIQPLNINRYGVIDNWPPDFLPEAADEAEIIFRKGLEKHQESK